MIGKSLIAVAAGIAVPIMLVVLISMPIAAIRTRDPFLMIISAMMWLATVGMGLASIGI